MLNKEDDLRDFSVADHLARHVDPAWEARKALGNERLAAKDFDGAIARYTEALQIALGPLKGGQLAAFRAALRGAPDGAAARRLAALIETMAGACVCVCAFVCV